MSHAKVSEDNPQTISLQLNEEIIKFYIPVYDPVGVYVMYSGHDLIQDPAHLGLRQSNRGEVLTEAAGVERHLQVEGVVLTVLKYSRVL